MEILTTVQAMRRACREARRLVGNESSLGLVPTMGALHEGHRTLLRVARERCDVVVASLFVNPTQFAAGEDFDRYPRTFEQDCAVLEAEGVDLLFAPAAEEMYPPGGTGTWVDVPALGSRLDGADRSGHFRGVATVVSKLFHIIAPDVAFFGQKDAAQLAVLRAMVRDLNFPVTLVACPTVRDADGLALSSRNRYLSPTERVDALAIFAALSIAETLAHHDETSGPALRQVMRCALQHAPGVRPEYVEVVDPDNLLPIVDVASGALLAVAAHVGSTRLIDNILLAPASQRHTP